MIKLYYNFNLERLMKITSLCYLEQDGKYLMLHRVKKVNDENHDKWIGIGGKFKDKESPFDCARREIREESGLCATELSYRGIVTFVSDLYGTEYMHLFTCESFTGVLNYDCDEGDLLWVDKTKITELPIWEGDKIFLKLLRDNTPFFSLKLEYKGDTLVSYTLE